MYKAQLAASLGIPEVSNVQISSAIGAQVTTAGQAWRTGRVTEAHQEFPLYEVELEYPIFIPESGDLEELNTVLRGSALKQLHDFRDLLITSDREALSDRTVEMTNDLIASFTIAFFNNELISVRFSFSTYGAGAAHPQHFTDVVNYQREPLIPLTLENIFDRVPEAIESVSRYAIAHILLENGDDGLSGWVEEGASPKAENFSKFNLTEYGLLITFDEYQVSSYVEGARQVIVPWNRLSGFFNPRCKVTKWFG